MTAILIGTPANIHPRAAEATAWLAGYSDRKSGLHAEPRINEDAYRRGYDVAEAEFGPLD